jgi:hypothetical protein
MCVGTPALQLTGECHLFYRALCVDVRLLGRFFLFPFRVIMKAFMSRWQAVKLPVGENGDVVLLAGSLAMLIACFKQRPALVAPQAASALKRLALV